MKTLKIIRESIIQGVALTAAIVAIVELDWLIYGIAIGSLAYLPIKCAKERKQERS